ncbi:MAG: alanine-tRNA synthetase second additional domain-containing protein [Prevotellaceae bacterium]|jgi:tRNA A37 threonylcarbamoyladenosine biosynthesis protein TsaE|nr:alanine-tRNA synthetase second additional domain-containing protein [Prevotellaceae bacterium]
MRNLMQEYMVFSQYFAPRGRERLLYLGEGIAQRHLHYGDRLIGIIGDAGSGKSSLIRGMFPGLELSNDDDTINPRKIMQVRELFEDVPTATTYHIDMRFQLAFTQMHEIVDFVTNALANQRRVVVEHFNLLCPLLGRNADILIGIGEEIIVTRPSIFGPQPDAIYNIVHASLKYRKIAHSIEDITILILNSELNIGDEFYYSADMRNGFVLKFVKPVEIDFHQLERRIREMVAQNLPISYVDEEHIAIGDTCVYCAGPRLHVRNTSEIGAFSFIKQFVYDPKTNTHCLIGVLSDDDSEEQIHHSNMANFIQRME